MGSIFVFPFWSMNSRPVKGTSRQENKKHEKTAARCRKTRRMFNVGKFWRAYKIERPLFQTAK